MNVCCVPETTYHGPHADRVVTPAGRRGTIESWRTAFPDYRYVIDHILAEGDFVVVNARYFGKHTGVFEWQGQGLGPWNPTGREIVAAEMFVFRVADGRIADVWTLWNPLDLMRQLGVASS